ncbi:MAG: YlbF family regulator [Oscillospiraceae bacterium]
MDVVAITRQLGAAIQQNDCYLKFAKAKADSEKDATVKEMMDKINEIREAYQAEAEKSQPDELTLSKFDSDFQQVYTALMVNENMSSYEESRKELDVLMNYIMQILYLCVNGENPETCEPQPEEHDCGGECSGCNGGCN